MTMAKPFMKWAGGKTQLLPKFEEIYPEELRNGTITKYVEPFVGSGAVFFDIAQRYNIEECVLNDANPDLVITYKVIQNNVQELIEYLRDKETEFLAANQEERKEIYYAVRENFNETRDDFSQEEIDDTTIRRAGQVIFLNRTCFNGLYRVNRSGGFNVPMGSYSNPTICNEENLTAVHQVLQNTTILIGDYLATEPYIDDRTFVYFDPPYRPLNPTSSFNSYSRDAFNDEQQQQLANYYIQLSRERAAFLMLSNSDPKNENPEDNFFDELYEGFTIRRVDAKRNINSKADKRGEIKEILITNYDIER